MGQVLSWQKKPEFEMSLPVPSTQYMDMQD
jgi:hypothetical protein